VSLLVVVAIMSSLSSESAKSSLETKKYVDEKVFDIQEKMNVRGQEIEQQGQPGTAPQPAPQSVGGTAISPAPQAGSPGGLNKPKGKVHDINEESEQRNRELEEMLESN